MITHLDIPDWVQDLHSFRSWVHTPEFPEKVPSWWLDGAAWIDLSRQDLFSHVLMKGAIYAGLMNDANCRELGQFFSSGIFFSNVEADLAGNPDGLFVSHESILNKRVQFLDVAGCGNDYDEIQGSPDMMLEVVSNSSEEKDMKTLLEAYWQADIREYWLVDARSAPLSFDIWRHTPEGYVASPTHDGWLQSAVYERAFRLTQSLDRNGYPNYRLEVR